mgnify:FL=1
MQSRHIAALVVTTSLVGGGAALAQSPGTGPEDDITPCEGGFYLADTDRDGTISVEELEEAALAAFARFDTDGSGDVTQAEYEACANAGAGIVGVPAQRVKSNLPEYDRNDDGMLSQKEFMDAAGQAYDQARVEANLDEGAVARPTTGGGEDMAETDTDAADQMQQADASEGGGGAMQSESEGMERARPGDAGEPAPVIVLRRFLFIPESQAARDPVRMSREEATARAVQTFAALDTDRSGQLEPSEWAKSRAVRQDLSDLIRSRFEMDDADASGTLTPDEFVAAEQRRMEQAEEAMSEGGDGANPPVVYFRYPHVM